MARGALSAAASVVAILGAGTFLAVPQAEAASPQWKLTVTPSADYFVSGGGPGALLKGEYMVEAENVGNAPTSSSTPIVLEDQLPAGTNALRVGLFNPAAAGALASVNLEACPSDLRCEYPAGPLAAELPAIQPHHKLVMLILVEVPETVSGSLEDRASVSGGAAASAAEATATNQASPHPTFGPFHFSTALTGSGGEPYTQAGGHPYEFSTEFKFGTFATAETRENVWLAGLNSPLGDPKQATAELPAGLLANAQAVPTCELGRYFSEECSRAEDAVGVACLGIEARGYPPCSTVSPIYNLQPEGDFPAELGVTVAGGPFLLITAGLRTGSDYGATASANSVQSEVNRARITLWGVPAEASHNPLRGKECLYVGAEYVSVAEQERGCGERHDVDGGGPAAVPPAPFLLTPTQCTGVALSFTGRYDTWSASAEFASRSVELEPVSGCNQLHFEPSIEARPTTDLADSPSGFDFDLKVPQNSEGPGGKEDPNGLATADLKEAVVKLPPGLVVNPSSGAGLEGCSPAQIGLTTPVGQTPAHFTESPAACPDASKLGSVEVNTQLLHNPLLGFVYLATPHQNPSGNLLAGYIVLEGEGVIIKLAGQFQADPQTGQITASFLENPQTPFEEFKFHFFEGARGALRTPAVCGEYTTTSQLTPYSHMEGEEEATPIATPEASFETTAPAHEGESCPTGSSGQPNAPAFRAGTESPQAGAFTPFSFRLAREDGSQEISKIETTLPPGLVGKLAGVGECSESQLATAASREHEGGGAEELASPACPTSSEVGTVQVAAGAGPTPLYVQGKAYLAGPYKAAPLSLAIITPAVAGPFDLGDVVVRTALYVDPFTAQIRAVSDQIPHILQGIPLDVRSVTLKMDRPNFTLNPTNCNELGFSGSATSVIGDVAPLTQRFQVGGCKTLGFQPKLAISLKGGTRRNSYPALTATLTMPQPGVEKVRCKKHRRCRVVVPPQADVAAAQVTLPHSAFLEQGHIDKTCGRPELAAHTCPAASIYGRATAVTPLLEKPLSGPVYLATGFGYTLPALVADLNGQIEVLLKGKVDTGREDGLRNTFEVVPDAPVTKFTLHMFGGKKGLIVNSENLCGRRAKTKALARFTAQSGKVAELEPTVANSCKHKHRRHHSHHRRHKGG